VGTDDYGFKLAEETTSQVFMDDHNAWYLEGPVLDLFFEFGLLTEPVAASRWCQVDEADFELRGNAARQSPSLIIGPSKM
jgi:hypothetical protein